MAGAAGEGSNLSDLAATIDALQLARGNLASDDSPEAAALLTQITALNASLQAYNSDLASRGAPEKAKVRLNFDSGKALLDKAGGCVTIEFRCKPGTTETDVGKLTGRVRALFMAVPRNMKHLMSTHSFEHPDGYKRWGIEVKFPFSTVEKGLTKAEMMGEKERAIFAHVKAYLEKAADQADAVPFHATMELAWETALGALLDFFDAKGNIREKIASLAGPEAQVEKRVANLHAELLSHIEGLDHVRVRTPERSMKITLAGLPLVDLFSKPTPPTISVDYKPVQEFVGSLGAGLIGGGTMLTDFILYQNTHLPETTMANTNPSSGPFNMPYEDVWIEMEDARIHCWMIKHPEGGVEQRPTVLMFHGNAGDMASRLQLAQGMINTVGCNVFMVSYRGYGDSTGRPTESGLVMDAEQSWAHLAGRSDINTSKIVLYGQSLGGAVAIRLAASAAKGLAAGLVIENTFTSIIDMAGMLAKKVHALNALLPSKWDSASLIEQVECPVLLLSGRKDKLVPPVMMDVLRTACKAPATLVEFADAGHNDTCIASNYFKSIESWTEQSVKQ
jgi:hypothetical protein